MDIGALFVEHHAPLFRYLSRLTGDPDVAEDAAQEAFVKLVEKPPAPGQTRAWLFKVGTHAAWLTLRTGRRRKRILEGGPDRAPVGDAPPAPDVAAETAAERARVRKALDGLPERERGILLMYQEGFKHREIGEAFGVPVHSVGTMIARALKKLAAELRLDDPEDA